VHGISGRPVHPASSSRAFPLLDRGERSCGWRKGLLRAQGIEKRFETMTLEEGARLAGARQRGLDGRLRLGVGGWRSRARPALSRRLRDVAGAAFCWNSSASPITWATSATSATTFALSFGFFQFWRLKEDLLRLNAALFGHRYLMDRIVPGGVSVDLPREAIARLLEQLERVEAEVATLKSIYDEHAGGAGPLHHDRAGDARISREAGLTGFAVVRAACGTIYASTTPLPLTHRRSP